MTISGAEKPVADGVGHTGKGGTWRVQVACTVCGGPNDAVLRLEKELKRQRGKKGKWLQMTPMTLEWPRCSRV